MTEIDPWEVAKAAAEDHYLPRMDGTVAPDHVQQAFIDGYAAAVEQLPSEAELTNAILGRTAPSAARAVLNLIRKRFEESK